MGGRDSKKRWWIRFLLPGLVTAGAVFLLWACRKQPAKAPSAGVVGGSAPDDGAIQALAAMDRSASPADHFYQYASGSWLRNTKLPPDRSTFSRSFSTAQDRNAQFGRDLLAGKYPSKDPARLRNIRNYYVSCMDTAAIEKLGTAPIQPLLDQIRQVSDMKTFLAAVGALQTANVPVLFGATVFPDSKDPTRNLLQLTQGGLGLPGGSIYSDPNLVALLQGFTTFNRKMLELTGMNSTESPAAAQRVVSFETELAKVSWSFADLNDATKTYNPRSFVDFQASTPSLPWSALFEAQQLSAPDRVNVQVPPFFAGLERIIPITSLPVLRDYLTVHLLLAMAQQLPQRFFDVWFDFYGRQLGGQQQPPSRASYCEGATLGDLGDVVAQQFVEISFPPSDKRIVDEMIADLQAEMRIAIENATWMDEATRKSAIEKAAAMVSHAGAPDTAPQLSGLKFDPTTWMANLLAVSHESFRQTMGQAGKPVDRNAWYTSPLTVNAYYDPQRNAIVVPAGILQPPFFGSGFPPAMNYGSIGAIVGHELTHGFDLNGRLFDAAGRLRDWWSEESAAAFTRRTQCYIDQYSVFQPFPGIHVDGKQTLNENIADNGGLKLAYAAYQRWKARHGTQPPSVAGLTDGQLFFVAFGQTWATISSEAFDRSWVARDPHTLPEYRVQGAVANSTDFAKAFDTKLSSHCEIW